ncbi:MAG TPA: gliding motility-associated C-terminal domain-containing protein [Cytophagaceae bacterium]
MIRTLFFFLLSVFPISSLFAHSNEEKQLKFVQNKNQWEPHILFKADLPSGNVFLHQQKLTWLFYDAIEHAHEHEGAAALDNSKTNIQPETKDSRAHAYTLSFVNSNPNAIVTGANAYNYYHNYFIGNDPAKWASNVPLYNEVWYKTIYDKIDLRIYEFNNSLKYEFIVAPKTSPDVIALNYDGLDAIYIKDGELHLKTSVTEIVEKKPVAYQYINNRRIEVPCEFVLRGSTVSFAFPQGYNKKYELIIDPELIFSTYSNSTADNWGNTACFDNEGNTYTAGTVFDHGLPTTIGTLQPNYNSINQTTDVAILKFNPNGTQLLYATYLGGYQTEVPHSIVVNSKNELVILGTTSSYNFPHTSNAAYTTFNGGPPTPIIGGISFSYGSDLFVSVINATGTALIGSTFIGGSDIDGNLLRNTNLTANYGDQFRGDIIVDSSDYIYVASHTKSTNFPVKNAIFPTFQGGDHDAVVLKLTPNVTDLIWSTYIGGSGNDGAYSIQLDKSTNVYIAGGTSSSNFPGTGNGYKNFYSSGVDGFALKINSSGNSIINATYVGTSSYDQVYFIQLDTEENVYLLGQTKGIYPKTSDVYGQAGAGQFIHKLNNDLTTSVWSTTVGIANSRQPNISPTAFLVNDCGNIFISGWGGVVNSTYIGGTTSNLPFTQDAVQKTTDGSDFYLMVLEKDAASLLYATFLGGYNRREHVDGGTSRFSKDGVVYQAVCANCDGFKTGFPTTPSAWSKTNLSDNCTNAVFKFDLSNLKARITADTTQGCVPKKIIFTNKSIGGKQIQWFINGEFVSIWPLNLSYTFTSPGEYTVTLVASDLTTCIQHDTASLTVTIFDVSPPLTPYDTICKGDTTQLFIGNYSSVQWSPDIGINNTSIPNPYIYPESSMIYSVHVTDSNNCSKTFEIPVEVASISPPLVVENITDCNGLPTYAFKLSTEGPLEYFWDFGDGEFSNEKEPTHTYPEPGVYETRFKIHSASCSYEDSIKIPVEHVFIPNLITPNNDGKNDVYYLKGKGDKWKLDIYNRWGEPIYTAEEYDNTWDGSGLSDGIYYFLITTPNARCKGWLQIIR